MSGSIEVSTISNTKGRLKTGLTGFKRFSDDLFEIWAFNSIYVYYKIVSIKLKNGS
ncbi:hypothetical protein NEISICOT_01706 [Neisseria sicca ATCC 29256]|jgi:hypothetical protein|uniref:Uncharacterized protein n=1 Tax=Neisseria sicca ATCC 29256 TaxID=547045 RepID=C6M5A7_NEISI|nr:hypothetical protein NEISICOT_01706 [Neisseria sicca ATCC 29256]